MFSTSKGEHQFMNVGSPCRELSLSVPYWGEGVAEASAVPSESVSTNGAKRGRISANMADPRT